MQKKYLIDSTKLHLQKRLIYWSSKTDNKS